MSKLFFDYFSSAKSTMEHISMKLKDEKQNIPSVGNNPTPTAFNTLDQQSTDLHFPHQSQQFSSEKEKERPTSDTGDGQGNKQQQHNLHSISNNLSVNTKCDPSPHSVSSTSSSVVEQPIHNKTDENNTIEVSRSQETSTIQHHHHHHHYHYHNHYYNYYGSDGLLAAKISATKDSIDDSQVNKEVLAEESTISKQSSISFPATELLQQKHSDIARTSSNISNYYLSSNEEKVLTGISNRSSAGLDDINIDTNSLQYHQYYPTSSVTEADGYLNNENENAPLSLPGQYSYASTYEFPHKNNIVATPIDSIDRRKSDEHLFTTNDKENSQYPKKDALSRLKSLHFPKKKTKPLIDEIRGDSLPSSPRSPRQSRSMNRFFQKNRVALQSISAFQKQTNSSDMSSRRSVRSSHGSSHHNSDHNQPFDFDQMQKALSETGSESTHSGSNRSGDRQKHHTPTSSGEQSRTSSTRQHGSRGHNYHQQQQQTNEIQVVSSTTYPAQTSLETVTESNGANNVPTLSSASNGNKKGKYKGLWGKVGQHGLAQAAARRPQANDEAETSSPAPSARVPSKKWDQVLTPLIQKQNTTRDKKLAKKQSKAEINYHMQQQQMQQAAVQMPYASAGGSYVFSETSGAGTVECDCGEDSCPNCNLLLQMSGSGW